MSFKCHFTKKADVERQTCMFFKEQFTQLSNSVNNLLQPPAPQCQQKRALKKFKLLAPYLTVSHVEVA